MPSVQVSAEPGPEAGEIAVRVDFDNFKISLTETDPSVVEGHWHLYVDGELLGMYAQPDVKIAGQSAGEHEVRVELTDTGHCNIGVGATTVVALGEGASHDGMSMDEEGMDGSGGHGSGTADEETIIGFLEVLPR